MNAESDLRALLADGGVPGAWTDDQVRFFERRCSEWIGRRGDLVLALLDSAQEHVDVVYGWPSGVKAHRSTETLAAAVANLTEPRP